MSRKTSILLGALLAAAPFVAAQELQGPSAPTSPEDSLRTQELIAWSSMQEPKPVPQPLPPPDKAVPQPDPQQKAEPAPADESPAQVQSFTGKIVKDGDRFVLKVSSGTSYQLDAGSGASQYENKDVKVVGVLDASSNTIRVTKIELLS